jgi:hypothetical protein
MRVDHCDGQWREGLVIACNSWPMGLHAVVPRRSVCSCSTRHQGARPVISRALTQQTITIAHPTAFRCRATSALMREGGTAVASLTRCRAVRIVSRARRAVDSVRMKDWRCDDIGTWGGCPGSLCRTAGGVGAPWQAAEELHRPPIFECGQQHKPCVEAHIPAVTRHGCRRRIVRGKKAVSSTPRRAGRGVRDIRARGQPMFIANRATRHELTVGEIDERLPCTMGFFHQAGGDNVRDS